MPTIDGLRVVKSRIHGYGVVATRDYQAGDVIADVDGVPLRTAEVQDDEYCLWINDEMYFDMVDQTRWINHCCDPNAHIEGEEDPDGRVWARVVAERDIKAGDEITYDYGFSLVHAIPCLCGVSTCRGWIVDPDELPALLAKQAQGQTSAQVASPSLNGAASHGSPSAP